MSKTKRKGEKKHKVYAGGEIRYISDAEYKKLLKTSKHLKKGQKSKKR